MGPWQLDNSSELDGNHNEDSNSNAEHEEKDAGKPGEGGQGPEQEWIYVLTDENLLSLKILFDVIIQYSTCSLWSTGHWTISQPLADKRYNDNFVRF